MSKLAGISNLSPFNFHRISKAFLGEPIGCYITRMRLETAARFLRYSRLPVQEIAFCTGYETPAALSRAFRQFFGVTPSDFRNNKTIMKMKTTSIPREGKVRFRKITGIILACLLLLSILNSTNYFFGILKVGFIEWLVFNACAPSSIT